MNQFKTNVLDGFLNSTDKTIHVGPIGAIDADNRYYHGYYMVESSYQSYTLQQNKPVVGKLLILVY